MLVWRSASKAEPLARNSTPEVQEWADRSHSPATSDGNQTRKHVDVRHRAFGKRGGVWGKNAHPLRLRMSTCGVWFSSAGLGEDPFGSVPKDCDLRG